MAINIGDTVRFLREVGGGKVTGFRKGGLILVEDKDGFEIPMQECDLVVIPDTNTAPHTTEASPKTEAIQPAGKKTDTPHTETQNQTGISLEERIARLEHLVQKLHRQLEQLEAANALRVHAKTTQAGRSDRPGQKALGKDEVIEIDLHANALLDTMSGLSATDIKDYQMKIFRQTMEQYKRDHGRRIVFIHGNGDGVLRKAILTELKYSYKTCRHQDASFQEYGFGATMVTIG